VWVALNVATFAIYGWDKRQARLGGRRVPEKRLWGLLALGGVVGGWLGMFGFRHKTRKGSFLAPAAGISALWIGIALWLASR
jgi:uncharacterized membrane protein YsdA (DUF1294 family)